ncbi:hypothetical protein [Niastella populi]|uniref:Uncharacterized protein n=1 Tax=Niastella populi TaxID=550983 RepID=A0A1V9G1V7_9BACT|nr:hypothetical protein [Niastella populi]OQP64603.1 hypothetical protein A4R26_16280 [Niastella populi]
MLDNLFNLVKQQAGDAIISNPAIPNQKNDEAVQAAGNSVVDTPIMKKMLAGATLLVLFCTSVAAQLPGINKNAAASPGRLLTQFTSALKPTSFLSTWAGAKEGILGNARKAATAVDIANTVSSLIGFIKPEMFKQGSTAKSLMNVSGRIKTMSDAAGLLKSLENGLKPEAFTSNWAAAKPGWLSALSQLK